MAKIVVRLEVDPRPCDTCPSPNPMKLTVVAPPQFNFTRGEILLTKESDVVSCKRGATKVYGRNTAECEVRRPGLMTRALIELAMESLGRKWAIQKEASESAQNFHRLSSCPVSCCLLVCEWYDTRHSSGERIIVPNRCVMGARSGREQGGENPPQKFFVGSGGWIRLDARCSQESPKRTPSPNNWLVLAQDPRLLGPTLLAWGEVASGFSVAQMAQTTVIYSGVPGSFTELTFGFSSSVTIEAGGQILIEIPESFEVNCESSNLKALSFEVATCETAENARIRLTFSSTLTAGNHAVSSAGGGLIEIGLKKQTQYNHA